ncbi:MAG: acetyl-CoA hydrolase, partial [Candidatus Micrarchaeota archaeon]
MKNDVSECLDIIRKQNPEKFVPEEKIFCNIHRGERIFIGTGCAEPQYLVNALIKYVESHPKAFFDAEVFHVWTLGVAPYVNEKFKRNFRHNSFFIGNNTRDAINRGLADYSPVFLSVVPDLLRRKLVPIDVVLIQTSPPDRHGYMSLGVSVDIVKAAIENSSLVITQVNSEMPRVHGDAYVHVDDVDFIVYKDEPILEYSHETDSEIVQRIGKYVSKLVLNGDTIQVGYGSIPN